MVEVILKEPQVEPEVAFVRLDLTPQEFAALSVLCFRGLGCAHPLNNKVDSVFSKLPAGLANRIRARKNADNTMQVRSVLSYKYGRGIEKP